MHSDKVFETTAVVVGAGFSGICMGYYLKQKGINNFIILEKGDSVGGTWHDNKYPGAECDVESHLYRFSFHDKHDWTRIFSNADEIEEYIFSCSKKHEIFEHIRFGEAVKKSVYDADTCKWTIETDNGTFKCNYFIPSCSPLHCPMLPKIPGLGGFKGRIMHTAQWDASFNMSGKRVAVIGNAASGVQCIPELAKVAKEVIVFQRTPNWILPKFNRSFWWIEKQIFRYVPFAQLAYRMSLYYYHEVFYNIFLKNSLAGRICKWISLTYLNRHIRDPALRAKLTPKYTYGCKRVLLTDNYFQCFNAPNVTLVTDGITGANANGIVTDGVRKEYADIDLIVCATGFDVFAPVKNMNISNMGSKNNEAYLGIYAKNAPNLFLLLGPNSGSAHNGIPIYVEAQAKHIAGMIKSMQDNGHKKVTVKEEVFDRFNTSIAGRLGKFVWDQCDNWYQQSGRNDTLFPGDAGSFVRDTAAIKKTDFVMA